MKYLVISAIIASMAFAQSGALDIFVTARPTVTSPSITANVLDLILRNPQSGAINSVSGSAAVSVRDANGAEIRSATVPVSISSIRPHSEQILSVSLLTGELSNGGSVQVSLSISYTDAGGAQSASSCQSVSSTRTSNAGYPIFDSVVC